MHTMSPFQRDNTRRGELQTMSVAAIAAWQFTSGFLELINTFPRRSMEAYIVMRSSVISFLRYHMCHTGGPWARFGFEYHPTQSKCPIFGHSA